MIVSMQIVVLPGRAVADDQLALAAANRDHRVDRHDAGLHRLADRTPADDPGRDLLDRVRRVAGNRPLAVERLAERVHDTPEQALADRDLQQLARPLHLVAFLELRVVAEDDDADFGFVEGQGEAGDAVPEIDHLVQHHVREPFDLGDAVADLADRPHALFREGGLRARDLRFDVAYQVSHRSCPHPAQPRRLTSRPRSHPIWPARCRRRRRCPP